MTTPTPTPTTQPAQPVQPANPPMPTRKTWQEKTVTKALGRALESSVANLAAEAERLRLENLDLRHALAILWRERLPLGQRLAGCLSPDTYDQAVADAIAHVKEPRGEACDARR